MDRVLPRLREKGLDAMLLITLCLLLGFFEDELRDMAIQIIVGDIARD